MKISIPVTIPAVIEILAPYCFGIGFIVFRFSVQLFSCRRLESSASKPTLFFQDSDKPSVCGFFSKIDKLLRSLYTSATIETWYSALLCDD